MRTKFCLCFLTVISVFITGITTYYIYNNTNINQKYLIRSMSWRAWFMDADFKSIMLERCYSDKSTMTPQRLLVLDTLVELKKPISAYELKDYLKKKRIHFFFIS